MADYGYRSNTIIRLSDGLYAPGASYTVAVYPVGGVVRANMGSPSHTIPLDTGHGFSIGDKFVRNPTSDNEYSDTDFVIGVSATGISMSSGGAATYQFSTGDVLFNVKDDNGSGTPNFDDSDVLIYSDMDGTNIVTGKTVTCDAQGGYEYWSKTNRVWELIRDADGNIAAVVKDIFFYWAATEYTQTYSTAASTANALTAATLTDSTTGSASQTLAEITGGGTDCEDATKNAIASLADEVNKLIADVLNLKQVQAQLIDDLQENGMAG